MLLFPHGFYSACLDVSRLEAGYGQFAVGVGRGWDSKW